MSIIYKGLNPKHHYGLCILTINGELITANGKHFQAIQIPTPHGRLIDGDAFIRHLQDIFCEKCEQHKKYGGTVCRICNIIDVILEYGDAPTILESEE